MFLESFKTTGLAVIQIMLLAGIGYTLAKKGILNDIGLGALSRLVVEVALPVLIFCQLTKDFSFSKYPHWWLFPLMSIFITFAGYS
jgi:predicted permease